MKPARVRSDSRTVAGGCLALILLTITTIFYLLAIIYMILHW